MSIKEARLSNVPRAFVQGFFQLYPDEAARLLSNLPTEEILPMLQMEPIAIAREVFQRLNPDIAAELVEKMEDDFFQKLFAMIDPAQGASLLAQLDKNRIEYRLSLLPAHISRELQELMTYPPDSAGFLMDFRVTTFHPEDTVEKALVRIRKVQQRRIMDICLIDGEGYLVGVIPLQEVAVSPPDLRLGDLIQGPPIRIEAMAPREEVVQVLEDRKLASLPVVDLDGKLLGIIRHDKLVSAAQQDASEDVQAMFGAGRDERALSKVSFAIRKRLPWLEINLATAFLAAAVVGLFEETIAQVTALAVFLPVVAGQSGNTGSQALAVTIRGLALREIRTRHWLRIVRKEVLAGFLNGLAVALTTSFVVYIWMASSGLAMVIGTSMIFSMVIAGLAGAIIPIGLKAFGQDPAQSSSIILTTVTDVVGFMSFLGLAKLLSHLLRLA